VYADIANKDSERSVRKAANEKLTDLKGGKND